MVTLTTLRRLQIAHLLFGMMFWYGVEQLFLNKYLHSSSARGYLTIAFTTSLLLFDIPGGMFADRFGRKKALLLACIAQTIALVILGSSNSLGQYVAGSIVFGVFISLLNGAAQALLYDHLALNSLAGSYGKQQGSIYAMFLVGAGAANLASGFIAHVINLRAPYFLSVIPSILAFIMLLPVAEPPLTKVATKWYAHLGDVLTEIRTRPRIIVFGLQFIVSQLLFLTMGEFGQIYILSFHVNAIALGALWSAVALFAAGGRFWAHRMQTRPRTAIVIYCVILLAFIYVHWWLGILLYCMVYGCNEALANVTETEVQDETKSSIRATLFSSVSFFGNVLAIPIVYMFNRLYVDHSIFTANTAMAIAVVCVLLSMTILAARLPKAVRVKPQAAFD